MHITQPLCQVRSHLESQLPPVQHCALEGVLFSLQVRLGPVTTHIPTTDVLTPTQKIRSTSASVQDAAVPDPLDGRLRVLVCMPSNNNIFQLACPWAPGHGNWMVPLRRDTPVAKTDGSSYRLRADSSSSRISGSTPRCTSPRTNQSPLGLCLMCSGGRSRTLQVRATWGCRKEDGRQARVALNCV